MGQESEDRAKTIVRGCEVYNCDSTNSTCTLTLYIIFFEC